MISLNKTKGHAKIHRDALKRMKTPPCLLWYTVKPSLYTVYKTKLKMFMKNVAEPTFFFRYPLTYELKKQ